MKEKIKYLIAKIRDSRISPIFAYVYEKIMVLQYHVLCMIWSFGGNVKPTKEEAKLVTDNVTFIYKSFERPGMAKRLYHNIQAFYPGARVIIADDSQKPLGLKGDSLTVVQLPFNKGLSYGLNSALDRVITPYTMKMDDDMLLTPFTKIHEQLSFMMRHPEVDLVAVQLCIAPFIGNPEMMAKEYEKFSMDNAPKILQIPHMTALDDSHYVMGKTPNVFLARTLNYRSIGYDNSIRMIDHHEFFFRAAGNLVSVMDIFAFVFHYHNRFDGHYDKYRSDWDNDINYIRSKYNVESKTDLRQFLM